MAISSVSATRSVSAPQKTNSVPAVDLAANKKPAGKDSTTNETAPNANFNVKMPPQATSNALGHTIGQHLNLQA